MKKIFFIFAMSLMSVVSVWAEESKEEISTPKKMLNFSGEHFEVSGTEYYNNAGSYSLKINGDNTVTISAKKNEIITKVKYDIGTGGSNASNLEKVRATEGEIDYGSKIIEGINATSLQIYSENVSGNFTIKKVIIYYIKNNDPVVDEYVQTETFTTTTANQYTGKNINITGMEYNANGLYLNSTKSITIDSKNNNSVKISRVELGFSSDFNGTINCLDDAVVDGSGTSWIITNIHTSSLTISTPNGNGQINNIKVYYVEVPEEEVEKTVSLVLDKNELNYSKDNIIVTGTNGNSNGLIIDNGNSLTIASDNGAEILKVDLHFSYYLPNTNKQIKSTAGKVSGSAFDWSVNNVNSTSLTITHPGYGDSYEVKIDNITVHYRERLAPSTFDVAAANLEGAYWTTFYSDIANYQAPEGTHVYKVSLNDTKITMTEIEDRIVNMGQGVVLKNPTEGNLSMTKVDNESSDDYSDNNLVGTSTTITNPAPGNVYVLNYKNTKGLAFYKLSSNGTIKANRAYLLVPSGSSVSAQEFFAFDATVTGVDNINAQDSEEEKVYDLQGRRIAKPAKGIYIVNGKKVIMK